MKGDFSPLSFSLRNCDWSGHSPSLLIRLLKTLKHSTPVHPPGDVSTLPRRACITHRSINVTPTALSTHTRLPKLYTSHFIYPTYPLHHTKKSAGSYKASQSSFRDANEFSKSYFLDPGGGQILELDFDYKNGNDYHRYVVKC